MYLAAFGLEAQVAFSGTGLAHPVDEFSVDGEFDDAIGGDHVIGVPLAGAFASELRGHAPFAARVFGYDIEAVCAEQFAADVAWVVRLAVLFWMEEGPLEF